MFFWVVLGAFDLILDVFLLGFLNGGFDSVAAMCVALDVFWDGVSDSAFVELMLFSDLMLDFRGTPWFSPWFGRFLVCFSDLLDCELDVVEVL